MDLLHQELSHTPASCISSAYFTITRGHIKHCFVLGLREAPHSHSPDQLLLGQSLLPAQILTF